MAEPTGPEIPTLPTGEPEPAPPDPFDATHFSPDHSIATPPPVEAQPRDTTPESGTRPVQLPEPIEDPETRAVGHGGGSAQTYLDQKSLPVSSPEARAVMTADVVDAQQNKGWGDTTVGRVFGAIARLGRRNTKS